MPVQVSSTARVRALVGAARMLVLAVILIGLVAASAPAASSNLLVQVDVPTSTTLGVGGCPSGVLGTTDFGTLLPGAPARTTTNDCVVSWSASNGAAALNTYQADGTDTAMSTSSATWTSRATQDTWVYPDVAAATASVAYVAASYSGIRATTNGGGAWTDVNPGAGSVDDVAVAPGTPATAVATTDTGQIYRTTDSGGSWLAEASGIATPLRDVSLVDSTNGFAVGDGGVVRRRTTGGGPAWTAATSIGTASLTGVSAVSTSVVFVAGSDGTLARSGNGGTSWATPTTACTDYYQSISAVDANVAYAVGTSGIITRLDWNGGSSTLTCTLLTYSGEDLHAVVAVPATTTVYAAGALGTLLRSVDAGTTWQRLRPGTAAQLHGLAAPTDGSIWVSGSSGTVSRAPTGTTFAVIVSESATATTLTAVTALDAERVVAVGGQVDGGGSWQAAIRTSSNGGGSWTNRTSNTTEALFGVAHGGGSHVVAVGDDGITARSSDAGATWTTTTAVAGVRLWDVDMSDRYRGWAVGDDGTIVRTTNGGVTWTQQASPVTTGLRAISAVDKDTAFAVGLFATVLRTTDGGSTWTSLAGIPTWQPLDDVSAADATTVYVAFGWQQVMVSTNAGAATPTWTVRSTGSSGDSLSIDAVSRTTAYVGTSWGKVTRTTDGGATWTTSTLPSSYVHAYGLDALDENAAWASGTQAGLHDTRRLPGADINDYDEGVADWSTPTASVFGACLSSWTGANVTPTWPVGGGCAPSGTGVWRAIPLHAGDAGSEIASSSTSTTATVSLRFGMYVPDDQPAGRYSAGISYEVVAATP